MPDGTFSRVIDDLVKCGYVSEYKRNVEKGHPKYIQLVDPFLLFHYKFLSGEKRLTSYSEIAGREGLFSNWRGHAFEVLCLRHLHQFKTTLGISGIKTVCYPWTSKKRDGGAQIDLVIERGDRITDLFEMKCTDKPFAISREYELKLLNKRDVFMEETGLRQTTRMIMVLSEGSSGTAHTEHVADIITKDDLLCV